MAVVDTPQGKTGFILRSPGPRPFRLATDARLVELIGGGHEAAFEELYQRHHRPLLSFCRHMLGAAEEAEDAVQHTFFAAHRHFKGHEEVTSPVAWLYAVARNHCLDVLRARKPVALLDDERGDGGEGLDGSVMQREDLRALLDDLRRLDPDARAALLLVELGELGHAEVASVLACPPNRVKKLVFRARSTLSEHRKARDMECVEVREELSVLRRGALRRTYLREHLRTCEDCRAFREQVAEQRRKLAIILPVLPSEVLRGVAVCAPATVPGKAAMAGGAAGKGLAVKIAAAVVLLGGGAAAATTIASEDRPATTTEAAVATAAGGAPAPGAGAAPAAAAGSAASGGAANRARGAGSTPALSVAKVPGLAAATAPAAVAGGPSPSQAGTPGGTGGARGGNVGGGGGSAPDPATPTPAASPPRGESSPSAGTPERNEPSSPRRESSSPTRDDPRPSSSTPSASQPDPAPAAPPPATSTPSEPDPAPAPPPPTTSTPSEQPGPVATVDNTQTTTAP